MYLSARVLTGEEIRTQQKDPVAAIPSWLFWFTGAIQEIYDSTDPFGMWTKGLLVDSVNNGLYSFLVSIAIL